MKKTLEERYIEAIQTVQRLCSTRVTPTEELRKTFQAVRPSWRESTVRSLESHASIARVASKTE